MAQPSLPSFLKAAEGLQIRGLTEETREQERKLERTKEDGVPARKRRRSSEVPKKTAASEILETVKEEPEEEEDPVEVKPEVQLTVSEDGELVSHGEAI